MWTWAKTNALAIRAVDGRTLVLGRRSPISLHVGDADYAQHGVYRAPVFSACPVTACHPGLYMADWCDWQADYLPVVFWLDEAILVNKLRVPRFRRLCVADALDADLLQQFEALGVDCLDAEGRTT